MSSFKEFIESLDTEAKLAGKEAEEQLAILKEHFQKVKIALENIVKERDNLKNTLQEQENCQNGIKLCSACLEE